MTKLIHAACQGNTQHYGFGECLIIVDNADDTSVLWELVDRERGTDRLIDFLPRSCKVSIIFTTRSESMATDLAWSNGLNLGKLQNQRQKRY